MRTNADFGRFLYELRPQGNPARLTFYNFIRNFTELQAPFTSEVVFKFYLKALSFEHWQKNVLELSQEISGLLEKYLGAELQNEDWKRLRPVDKIQVIKLRNVQDQCEVIHQFILKKKLNLNFKVYADKNNSAHAVLLYPQGHIQVMTFDDQAIVLNGNIYPIIQDRKLEYNNNLELSMKAQQFIQVTPFITAKFQIQDGFLSGDYIRGYTLQNYKKIEVHQLSQEPQLLHAIKRIERFFIDRASEPIYVEMIKILEETIEYLKQNHPGSIELAKKAVLQGQHSLENIFVDDKLMSILLKEIQHLLNLKGVSWNPSESINSLPKPEWHPEEKLKSL